VCERELEHATKAFWALERFGELTKIFDDFSDNPNNKDEFRI
jgi:hypothetical protein